MTRSRSNAGAGLLFGGAPPPAPPSRAREAAQADEREAPPPTRPTPPADHAPDDRPRWEPPADREPTPEPGPDGAGGRRQNPPPVWGGRPMGARGRLTTPYRLPYVVEGVVWDADTGYRRLPPRYFGKRAEADACYRERAAASGVSAAWIASPYGVEAGFDDYCRFVADVAGAIAHAARGACDPSLTPDGRSFYRRLLSTLHGVHMETEWRQLHPGEPYPGYPPDPTLRKAAAEPDDVPPLPEDYDEPADARGIPT